MKKGSWLLKEFTCEAYAADERERDEQDQIPPRAGRCGGAGIQHHQRHRWQHRQRRMDGQHAAGVSRTRNIALSSNARKRFLNFPAARVCSSRFTKSMTMETQDWICHAFGRFRLSATTNAAPLKVDPFTPTQRKLLAVAPDQRTAEQQRELFNVFRHTDASFSNLNAKLDSPWTNWVYVPTTLALQQRTEPRHTRIFKRGDWQRLGDEVQAEVPKILHPLPDDAPRNRLGFAKWIVDRRAPTTARVLVNRVWQAYFGQGLFTTPEDIGTRVEAPSHPELLDWLAVEFMEPKVNVEARMTNDERNPKSQTANPDASLDIRHSSFTPWSLKHLHRLIVTSATYKQSSRMNAESLARDPYNHLLARGPRFRVESEIVQDIALAASGLLNPKIGGPSVRPPIPASVGDTVYGGFSWPETAGEERYRRGMYTFWKRALPFPSMLAFDAPTADSSCTRRVRSNTPLQALTTLNEKTFVEAAQAMGLRVYREGGGDERSRANYAFRLCAGRAPSERELSSLLKFYDEQLEYFEERTTDALKVGSASTNFPPNVNMHKVAAWAMVSRAILNLDETITKE